MSTKYTREQIDKARQLADHAFSETAHRNRQHDGDIVAGSMRRPGDEWIDVFTEALGLDVEDEKPEPGTWHFTRTEGWPAYVEWDGDLIVFEPGALDHYRALANDWPDLDPATPPARMVAAEHGHGRVEVSREQVEKVLNDAYSEKSGIVTYRDLTDAVMELLEASK